MFPFFSNKGILGINARNLLYMRPYNPKKAVKLADDKIKTKQFLSARDIPVPKLYGIIRDTIELEKFDFNALPDSFALKPNTGYGGEGIIPVTEVKDGYYYTAGGTKLSKEEMKDHIRDILDGRFSISNVSDFAFFEQYIEADERIGKYSYEGLPDIRVIVHNLIPVMAMLRLPTKESKGKANLHIGAVGIGIDIAKGQTTHISYKNRIIEELPDGMGSIKGLNIPFWDQILTIASTVQLVTNLGYMAVDICIDKNTGPVLLEINARAGLGVQIANLAPLRKRLERIEGVKVTTPAKGVRIAKDMFGNIVEKGIAQISGKQVISINEKIEIIQKQNTIQIAAKVDTGKKISILDEETAIKCGLLDNENDYDDEKSTLKLKFTLKGKRIHTIVEIEKIPNKEYKIILGTRDLQEFLIDTNLNQEKKDQKNNKNESTNSEKEEIFKKINFFETDQQIINLDNKIKLLYHLRPINLEEEKKKFFKNTNYNPEFEYPTMKFNAIDILDELGKIETDSSTLGKIYEEKKKEIIKKINLLESIDEENFSKYSIELYGQPTEEEYEECKELIKKSPSSTEEKANIDSEQAKMKFEEAFKKYGLSKWKVKIKEDLVSNCVAGKNNSLFIKRNATFSEDRIEELIIHEIETHILTAENGKMQPYEILNRGSANYLTTQEGLAMYNVENQRNKKFTENSKALSHVIAIYEAMNSSFSKVYSRLVNLGLTKEQAFRSTIKAKRGFNDTSKPGAFTKDYLYFKGYIEVKEFVKNGGKIEDLYLGKFNIKDLETIKSINGIKAAKHLPKWLK
ncbi:MAG: DUF1704 domain-containing protein [Candidatus Peregrinibacteria bacterium]|nr:DUF1704 domain-containing protein [Candidatus Peregrinibacteria bacterium]